MIKDDTVLSATDCTANMPVLGGVTGPTKTKQNK